MNLIDALCQPWAIRQDALRAISGVLLRHSRGERLEASEIERIVAESPARQREAARAGREMPQSVAVIPVQGVIAKHSREVNGGSQPRGTSVEMIRRQLAEAIADEDVAGIVLDVDSPGGTATGIADLADEIRIARELKPITAHVDGMAASAAYWIASQANQVVATQDSEVGSIGVYAPVVDDHRAYEAEGVDVQVVSSGGVKGQGYPGTKMSDEAKAELQASVDALRDFFVDDIAQGREMERDSTLALADGRTHFAGRAIELGLVDQIGSFADAVASVAGSTTEHRRRSPATKADTMAEQKQEPAVPTNVEQLAEAFPSLVAEIRDAARAEAHAETAVDPTAAERERVSVILSAATSSQSKLAAKLVEDGVAVADAVKQLAEDPRREAARELAERVADSGEPIDGSADEVEVAEDESDADPAEEAAKAWRKDKGLQAEFPELEDYIAFARVFKEGD